MDQNAFIAELQELLAAARTPEQYEALVDELARKLPRDFIESGYRSGLVSRARSGVTLKAFQAFYELLHGNKILDHNLDAAEKCFKAHDIGEIFLYLGARGFRKTSTMDVTLGAFLIGHHPHMTGLVTGANDDNAKLIARLIAAIIQYHPAWKEVFPYVVPKEKAWGAEGYWVIQTHRVDGDKLIPISREEWEQQQAKTLDPTFVGGGYKSSLINGKHPSLFLIVDDLHDIDSSASVKEREYIKQVFLTQILPTVIREHGKLLTWIIMTGVPFAKDDTYQVLRDSGGCTFVSVPAMRRAAEGTEGAVYIDGVNPSNGATYEDIKGWWVLTWPENFGVDAVYFWRSKGKSMFWQMFMLDIEIAKTAGLTYYLYDEKSIEIGIPMYGGADPTNVEPDKEVGGKKRSSFALCHLGKLPQGGAVVVDGFLKPCGIVDAKEAILTAQTIYPNWRTTAVENVGGGAVFLQYLHTDARVKAIASDLLSPTDKKLRDKTERFDKEVAPWLENAVLRISTRETPYNMALRRLCDNFFDLPETCEEKDAGDALYHAIKQMPEVFRVPVMETPFQQMQGNPYSLQSAWSEI